MYVPLRNVNLHIVLKIKSYDIKVTIFLDIEIVVTELHNALNIY